MDYLADIGITANSTGMLSLNTTTFDNAISNNFSGVANLLSDSATCSNSQFQYVLNSIIRNPAYIISVSANFPEQIKTSQAQFTVIRHRFG